MFFKFIGRRTIVFINGARVNVDNNNNNNNNTNNNTNQNNNDNNNNNYKIDGQCRLNFQITVKLKRDDLRLYLENWGTVHFRIYKSL